MFCIYKNGAVQKTMRGNGWFITEDGTKQPPTIYKLWSADELATLDIYRFEDRSKKGYDRNYQNPTNPVDAAPKDGVVIRTTTPVYKNIAILKVRKKFEATKERKNVSVDMIYWADGSNKYVIDISNNSQDKFVRATVHGNESGISSRKWTLIAETGTDGDTWTSARPTFTLDKFKAIGIAIGDHVDACHEAEITHHAAIDALSDQKAVADYDVTTVFPVTPIHPDNREG
jgi:hypothetical protein|tara:strand:+ start:169 stop:858 length:690 start_codon:yes stop_codon:yes gene_type:complete